MRRPNKREWTLISLALAAAVAVIAARRPDSADPAAAVAEAAPRTKHKAADTAGLAEVAELDPTLLRRPAPAGQPGDAFQKKSWYVPPPPPPPVVIVPPPPPPPEAPPLPFSFMGQYVDGGKPVIFLTAGDRLLMVHAGEVVDGTYRIEGFVGARLQITYLPLNIKQFLDTGSAG